MLGTLRSQIIRLAYTTPSIRPQILGILQKTGAHQNEFTDNRQVRIHKALYKVVVTDLQNAGKKGKICREMTVTNFYKSFFSGREWEKTISSLHKASSYEEILDMLYSTAQLVKEKYPYDNAVAEFHETERRGVDVLPANLEPIVIKTNDFFLRSEVDDFAIQDRQSHSTYLPAVRGGEEETLVFFRWVTDNLFRIKQMSCAEVIASMEAMGVRYRIEKSTSSIPR